ncbi:MAG TPA: isoprenyl transferase [Clostridiaceae bacterium]|nr:isoprenyl transferase [Clostridiaceae bacterium]
MIENAESRNEGVLRHLAVIMDGNGRWAKKRHLSREIGHRRGAENLRTLCILCRERKIQYLTVYAFSTENWKRSAAEVGALMRLITLFFRKYAEELEQEGIRLQFIGDRTNLPAHVIETIEQAEESSKDRRMLRLIIAFNYGGRREIVEAARSLSLEILAGAIRHDDLTEQMFAQHLYLSDVPDPDLIVRTGGEMRLSNFLLWQAAYAEFYSVDCLWPDFGAAELDAALDDYKRRHRRFGGR